MASKAAEHSNSTTILRRKTPGLPNRLTAVISSSAVPAPSAISTSKSPSASRFLPPKHREESQQFQCIQSFFSPSTPQPSSLGIYDFLSLHKPLFSIGVPITPQEEHHSLCSSLHAHRITGLQLMGRSLTPSSLSSSQLIPLPNNPSPLSTFPCTSDHRYFLLLS